MKIEIWSDVACPFCYIGERSLELALEQFAHRDDVELIPRSFELDPGATPGEHRPLAEALAAKFGTTPEQVAQMQSGIAARAGEVGLDFDTSQASATSTFDAHRLVHLARESGQDRELLARLMRDYFSRGLRASDHDALTAIATSVGLPETRVREVLNGAEFGDAVRADEARAQAIGVGGVPLFLIDGAYAVSGAQPVETFTQVLDQVWAEAHPTPLGGAGDACTDASCAT